MQTALSSNGKSTNSGLLCGSFNLIATVINAEWLLLRRSAGGRGRGAQTLGACGGLPKSLIKLDNVNDY